MPVHLLFVDPAWPATADDLPPPERRRAERLRDAQQRERHVRSRSALRRVMSQVLRCAPAEVPLRPADETGGPALPGTHWSVSLAHHGPWSLIALSSCGPVGVDLEGPLAASPSLQVARALFDPDESQWLVQAPPSQRAETWRRLWLRKEAVGKAAGRGLGIDLRGWSVAPGPRPTVPDVHGCHWRLHEGEGPLPCLRWALAAPPEAVVRPLRAHRRWVRRPG